MKRNLTFLLLLLITSSLYSQLPTNGLVAYYPFKGNANDETGNGHNGTVSGASLTTDRFNVSNNAYSFDGINDYIKVLNSNVFNFTGGDFSISVWMDLFQASSDYNSTMVSKRDGVPGNTSGFIYCISGQLSSIGPQKVWFQTGGGGNPYLYDYDPLTLNNWHNIVVTFKVSNQETKLYVDHILKVTSYTVPHHPTNDASLFFGHDSLTASLGYNYNFNGKLDDIGLFNRTLTQLDVDTLFYENTIGINENPSSSMIVNINTLIIDNNLSVNSTSVGNSMNIKLAITNLLGQTLYDKDCVIENDQLSENIDISNYRNGIYIIRLYGGNNYFTEKIVIAR